MKPRNKIKKELKFNPININPFFSQMSKCYMYTRQVYEIGEVWQMHELNELFGTYNVQNFVKKALNWGIIQKHLSSYKFIKFFDEL